MALAEGLLDNLARKYGRYSSWAIWNPKNLKDTKCITKDQGCLNTRVVMVGLNVSRTIGDTWQNFHGSDHARKLKYAFNDSPYRGAYMTDIIKGEVEIEARKVRTRIRNGSIDINEHIDAFRAEMDEVGVHPESLVILFGNEVDWLFTRYLGEIYRNHVRCPHYSRRGTDADWVEDSWTALETHYKSTSGTFQTLEFGRNDQMKNKLLKLRAKQRPNQSQRGRRSSIA